MSDKLAALLVVLLFGNIFGFAQLKQKKSLSSALVLEVTFFRGNPPVYQPVSPPGTKTKWVWYSHFRRIPNFQPSGERPPVRAVKFVPLLEKEIVKIKVSVYTGNRGFEREELVGFYSAKKNKRIVVEKLANFGVEPFEVKVIQSEQSTSVLPRVENRTTSLQIAKVSPQLSALPAYRIELLNSANKDIVAFTFTTTLSGKPSFSGMPQGERGNVLIKAGETLVKEIPASTNFLPSGRAHPRIFSLTSVVFADGSYEGSSSDAARFLAFVVGRKQQVKQIISLVRAFEGRNPEVNLEEFIRQASRLETRIGDREMDSLMNKFSFYGESGKRGLRSAAEIASMGVKKDFLSELKKHRGRLESREARAILKDIGKEYEDWLERLQ